MLAAAAASASGEATPVTRILRGQLQPALLIEDQQFLYEESASRETIDGKVFCTGTISSFHSYAVELIDESESGAAQPRRYKGIYREKTGRFLDLTSTKHQLEHLEHEPYTLTTYRVDEQNYPHLDTIEEVRYVDNNFLITAITHYYPLIPVVFGVTGKQIQSQRVEGVFEEDDLNVEEPYTITTTLRDNSKYFFHAHPVKGCISLVHFSPTNPHEFLVRTGRFRVDSDPLVHLRTPTCEHVELMCSSRPHPTRVDHSLIVLETGSFDDEDRLHTEGNTASQATYTLPARTAADFFATLMAQDHYDPQSLSAHIETLSVERDALITGSFRNGSPHGIATHISHIMQEEGRVEVVCETPFDSGKKHGKGRITKYLPLPATPPPHPLHVEIVIIENCLFNNDRLTIVSQATLQIRRVREHSDNVYIKKIQYTTTPECLDYDMDAKLTVTVGDYHLLLPTLRACEKELQHRRYPHLQPLTIGRRLSYANERDLLRAKQTAAVTMTEGDSDDDEVEGRGLDKNTGAAAAAAHASPPKDSFAQHQSRYDTVNKTFQARQERYQQLESKNRALQALPSTLKKSIRKTLCQKLNELIASAKEEKRHGEALLSKVALDLRQGPHLNRSDERTRLFSAITQRLKEIGRSSEKLHALNQSIETTLDKLKPAAEPQIDETHTPAASAAAAVTETTPSYIPLTPELAAYCKELREYYEARRLASSNKKPWEMRLIDLGILIENAEYGGDPETQAASIAGIKRRWDALHCPESKQRLFPHQGRTDSQPVEPGHSAASCRQ